MNEERVLRFSELSTRPIHCFPLTLSCKKLPEGSPPFSLPSSYEIPDTSILCDESSFATVRMGWSEQGLGFDIQVESRSPSETEIERIFSGDGIELFLDTRDKKSKGLPTRFCHHFAFVPKSEKGIFGLEVTKFRTEDTHPLADPNTLRIETKMKKKGYQMLLFLPSESLQGYDPTQFQRIGFTYRIYRQGVAVQHLQVSSDEFSIEQNPYLWATIRFHAGKESDEVL